MASPVFKLSPGINSYDWGRKGSSGLAAQLGSVSIPDFEPKEDQTYAELWMGTHHVNPSHVASDHTLLSTYLSEHPELIGEKVAKTFPDAVHGNLPFLFKVLSIGTGLSIQAHPSKELAQKLHAERPNIYKDPNHKPEMAIALTPFLAFLNFLPLPTLLLYLLSVQELDSLIPSSLTEKLAASLTLPSTRPPDSFLFEPTVSAPTTSQKGILKEIFAALMSAPEDAVKVVIDQIVARYKEGTVVEAEKPLVELTLMLNEQYPGDVGVLCVYMLNVVELKEGEAAFLGADMPHAYIKGEIIECMATSDNVVRAGLTPKLRDVPTLVEMLTYEAGPGSKQLLQPTPFDTKTSETKTSLLYDPPIDEFSVVRIALSGGKDAHRAVHGPSICVVTGGEGRVTWEGAELGWKKGEVLFIGAGTPVEWSGNGQVFRAYVEA